MRLFLVLSLALVLPAQQDPLQYAKSLPRPAAFQFLETCTKEPGFAQHPPLIRAAIYLSLGILGQELGQYRDAEHSFRRGVMICGSELLGIQCSLANWNGLLALYIENRQLGQAGQLIKQVSQRDLSSVPPTSRELFIWWGNLGGYEFARARPAEAASWYNRALAGWTSIGERDSMDSLFLRSNIGVAHFEQKQYLESVAVLEEVYNQIRHRSLEERAAIPSVLSNLALAKSALGETTKASELLREAVALVEQGLGADHPMTAHILLQRSQFLDQHRQKSEARQLRKRAEAILKGFVREEGLHHTVDIGALKQD